MSDEHIRNLNETHAAIVAGGEPPWWKRWAWPVYVILVLLLFLTAVTFAGIAQHEAKAANDRAADARAAEARTDRALALVAQVTASIQPGVSQEELDAIQKEIDGIVAAQGAAGAATLVPGPAGRAGAEGPPGPVGPPGSTGPPGSEGAPGLTGSTGATGATGAVGPGGETGPAGPQGEVGPTGAQGEPGVQGIPGEAGKPPASFSFSFSFETVGHHTVTVERVCSDPDGDLHYTCVAP